MSATTSQPVAAKLSTLDRYLPLWIGAAMVAGLLLGRLVPDLDEWLDGMTLDTVSLPIAIGLLAMMYPVLAKVRYRRIGDELAEPRSLVFSLFLNWVAGPLLMFTLAWVFLADLPELRTGLIIVGLARCIAMVLIWNDLACGSRELGAGLVAVNSVFQIVMFSLLGWFYLSVLPEWLGLETQALDVSMVAAMISRTCSGPGTRPASTTSSSTTSAGVAITPHDAISAGSVTLSNTASMSSSSAAVRAAASSCAHFAQPLPRILMSMSGPPVVVR
jgi:hypothetical protein